MIERWGSFALLAAGCALAACGGDAVALVDGGVARRLEIQDPPGAQIGLRYGTSVDLVVRYLRDDTGQEPLRGEPIHFAIFDDPAGSTLARDVVSSDGDGLAAVALSAGTQEGSFRVRASASGAPDVEFAISISQLEFVELDAELSDPLPSPGARALRASLYVDHSCSELQATPVAEGAARTLLAPSTARASLAFVNLLSRHYAITGRVEDAGVLAAYGCLDVDRALVPPGAHLAVPITLRVIAPSVTGHYALTTDVATTRQGRSDALFSPYDVVDRCEAHLGQLLLDELVARMAPSRASDAAALRGPAVTTAIGQSMVACRPVKAGSDATLDAELDTLLGGSATGALRGAILADLDSILGSGSLSSSLTLVAALPLPGDDAGSPQRLLADHEAERVALSVGSATHTYDLRALGRPLRGQAGIEAHRDGAQLLVGAHDLPIGLAELWGLALSDLSIAPRLPALADPTIGGWVNATVAAASRNGMTGCAAVEDLLCERTDPTACAGTLLAACADAVAAVSARLQGSFADTSALRLTGSATVVDDDHDLVGDRLTGGELSASGPLSSLLPFSGQRATP